MSFESQTLETRKLHIIRKISSSLTWVDLLEDLGKEFLRMSKELAKFPAVKKEVEEREELNEMVEKVLEK